MKDEKISRKADFRRRPRSPYYGGQVAPSIPLATSAKDGKAEHHAGDVLGSRLLAALSGNSGFVSSALSARTCNEVKRLPSRRWANRTSHRRRRLFENEDEYDERRTPNGERETVKELENGASCRYVEWQATPPDNLSRVAWANLMSSATVPSKRRAFGVTMRRDAWWTQPLFVFLGLGTFLVYSTWAAFQGNHYWLDQNGANYLSPFYSPELFGASPHAIFGPKPAWWPSWLLFSPALLVLWAPAGFRLTCYYYRGAYYKAFWADPPACAVGEPRIGYPGETAFPLILQNIHRYFLYLALIFILVLLHDAWSAFWFADQSGARHFGLGVGTMVLTLNVILLGGYTFGCHSLRHLAGGFLDQLSKQPIHAKCYACVSGLNRRHMLWAWMSLFWVGFSDVYVRLCSMGIWHDWRIF